MQYKGITRDTLLSYLDDYVRRGSQTVFAHRRGLRLLRCSYEQLVMAARQTARELQSRGIGESDRVILCGPNSPDWAAAFWACLLLGAIVVPLDKESTVEFARSVQQQTNAKLLITTGVVQDLTSLNVPLLSLDDLNHKVKARDTSPVSTPNLNDSTLAEIIFTSGTTSMPKGVMLTHGNLLANLLPLEYEITKYLKWERFVHPVRFLNLVPLSHVFGQFMGMFVPQLLGAEVHFHDSLSPAEIVERTQHIVVPAIRVQEGKKSLVRRLTRAEAAEEPALQEIFLARLARLLG